MSEILDDPARIRGLDEQSILAIHMDFHRHLEAGVVIGSAIEAKPAELDGVVLCGMGGSAISADLIRSWLAPELTVPLWVNRSYELPLSTGASTLVVVSSYSGNTEETLSAFAEARSRGCPLLAVSSGGEITRLARESGLPLLEIPAGMPPRTTTGYGLAALALALAGFGVVSDKSREIDAALPFVREQIRALGPESPLHENRAKRIAAHAQGRIPIVYGSQSFLDSVAVRWAGQFCENGKNLAFASVLPEMNHNEIAGWVHPREALRKTFPIFLVDRDDHPRIQRRIELSSEILEQKAGSALILESEGESRLQRILSLVLLGDFASIYLAILNGENPTTIEPIDFLKSELGSGEVAGGGELGFGQGQGQGHDGE